MIAVLWNRKSVLKSWAISRTSRWKGNFLINSSVDFWYRLISLRATVPGRYRWGFLTPPVEGALFLAALVASCFLGALPPVLFLAVCFVLAISLSCSWVVIWVENCGLWLWIFVELLLHFKLLSYCPKFTTTVKLKVSYSFYVRAEFWLADRISANQNSEYKKFHSSADL